MDKIIQISGFSVENTSSTQCNYMIVGLTESGKVLITTGDGQWSDISAKEPTAAPDSTICAVFGKLPEFLHLKLVAGELYR